MRVWFGVVKVKAGMGWVFCGLPKAPGSGVGAAWWSGCREGRPCVLCFMLWCEVVKDVGFGVGVCCRESLGCFVPRGM